MFSMLFQIKLHNRGSVSPDFAYKMKLKIFLASVSMAAESGNETWQQQNICYMRKRKNLNIAVWNLKTKHIIPVPSKQRPCIPNCKPECRETTKLIYERRYQHFQTCLKNKRAQKADCRIKSCVRCAPKENPAKPFKSRKSAWNRDYFFYRAALRRNQTMHGNCFERLRGKAIHSTALARCLSSPVGFENACYKQETKTRLH